MWTKPSLLWQHPNGRGGALAESKACNTDLWQCKDTCLLHLHGQESLAKASLWCKGFPASLLHSAAQQQTQSDWHR